MGATRIAGAGLALLLLAGAARGEAESCPPFGPAPSAAPGAAVCDPGITPSRARGEGTAGGGAIVPLGAPGEPEPADRIPGEALLALPRRPDGSVPTDFELAPGAELAESYWSPVLCATVARVVGAEGAEPGELVPVLPSGALVVPHSRYAGAAAEVREPAQRSAEPDDPYLPLQYGLAEVGALAARSVSDGAGVTVAVLDSAPDTRHRELRRVRVAPLDDGPPTEPAAHGTLVSGVIAATQNNAFGIAGVAPGADLVVIPVCSPAGSASALCRLYDVLRGIDRAWELDAAILNLSIVGPPNRLLERAAERLEQLGPVVVAAAGNEGTSEPRYPAAYPTVVGVGASGPQGRPAERSNRGPSAQILAPGVEVLSTVPGDSFAFGDGTSLAAAHVTAVLALLTSAGGDAGVARAELFRAGLRAEPGTVRIPPVCDALARLGRPCAGAAALRGVSGSGGSAARARAPLAAAAPR